AAIGAALQDAVDLPVRRHASKRTCRGRRPSAVRVTRRLVDERAHAVEHALEAVGGRAGRCLGGSSWSPIRTASSTNSWSGCAQLSQVLVRLHGTVLSGVGVLVVHGGWVPRADGPGLLALWAEAPELPPTTSS